MVVTVLVVEVLGEGLASLGSPIGVVALLDEVPVALLAQSGELPPLSRKPKGPVYSARMYASCVRM